MFAPLCSGSTGRVGLPGGRPGVNSAQAASSRVPRSRSSTSPFNLHPGSGSVGPTAAGASPGDSTHLLPGRLTRRAARNSGTSRLWRMAPWEGTGAGWVSGRGRHRPRLCAGFQALAAPGYPRVSEGAVALCGTQGGAGNSYRHYCLFPPWLQPSVLSPGQSFHLPGVSVLY